MANEANVTVENVSSQVLERKDGKGSFTAIEILTTDGKLFKGYDNHLPKDGLNKGDEINIKYVVGNMKTGDTFNKILLLSKGLTAEASRSTSNSTSSVRPSTTRASSSAKASSPAVSLGSGFKSSFDNKGARTGGVLHDAVAIAVHNASQNSDVVSLKEVESLARELLAIAARLEA